MKCEVVLCERCKYGITDENKPTITECFKLDIRNQGPFFCAAGERRGVKEKMSKFDELSRSRTEICPAEACEAAYEELNSCAWSMSGAKVMALLLSQLNIDWYHGYETRTNEGKNA